MTNNNTRAKIDAMKDEIRELSVKGVKLGAELGEQIHKNEQIRKEQAFNKECEEMGIRFW